MQPAPVELSAYDPAWPERFEAEKRALLEVLHPWLHGGIEHVGSTAVPGLMAKPVIDIMGGVTSLPASMPALEVLLECGYVYFPYKIDVMHWFCKPSPAHRTHHLHLIPYDSPLWRERLLFRDLLRTNEGIARDYEALKQDLAGRFREDREAYTLQKGPFIQQILEQAVHDQTPL